MPKEPKPEPATEETLLRVEELLKLILVELTLNYLPRTNGRRETSDAIRARVEELAQQIRGIT